MKILETLGKIKNIEDTIKGDKNNMKKSETQFKKLKLDERIVFGIIILVGLITMPIDAYATPTIIDFEDLPTIGLGEPGQILVFNQYNDKGITFNGPSSFDYSKQNAIQNFAHSGTKAIEQCYGEEFCTTPIVINFTAAQKRVKVWVGYSTSLAKQKTVFLAAYDINGIFAGFSAATFQPSSTPIPIQTPIEIVSDNANIYSVKVYLGPDPNTFISPTNHLAIDDVEFDTAGPASPCTSTTDPTVTLTQPSGQTVQFNDFILRGTVSTTAPLENATVIITGSGAESSSSNSFDILNYDIISRNGGNFVARFNDMLFPGSNTITVKVKDCKSSGQNSNTIIFGPIANGTVIKLMGMEITQAIQDMQNTVPLIANKRTVVRAYLRVEGSTGQINNVSGTLYAARPLNSDYPPILDYGLKPTSGVESLNAITVDSINDVVAKRRSNDTSLNFELPPDWITGSDYQNPGRLHMSLGIRIEGKSIGPRCDGCDNLDKQGFPKIIYFEKAPPVSVKFFNVPYVVKGVTYVPRQKDFGLVRSWLQRAYPTDNIITNHAGSTSLFYGKPKNRGPEIGYFTLDDVLSRLSAMRLLSNEAENVKYYGLVNNSFSGIGGLGEIAGYVSAGRDGFNSSGGADFPADTVGGHELGHIYGRGHPGSGCGDSSDDPGYPYPSGMISGPDMRYFGFDVGDASLGISQRVYGPTSRDIMTYCSNWISNYTYTGILDMLFLINLEKSTSSSLAMNKAISNSNDGLLVQGKLNLTDDSIELSPFIHISGLEFTSRPENSSFSVDLLDSTGSRLASYPFESKSNIPYEGNESKFAFLAEVVPYVNGTKQIVITNNSKELASRTVSTNVPQVKVIYPNGGEKLNEITDVTWQSSDADGDKLVYTLMYSNDAGKTWQAIATGIEEQNYTVNLEELPGSDISLFRVVATDGVNTGKDDSDAVFNVSNKLPEVRIISPGDSSSFTTAQTIVFVGDAFDLEDGYLKGDSLEWSSDKQGTLGFNSSIYATGLMPGNHAVTLTVKDKSGNVNSDIIRVQITQVVPVADAGTYKTAIMNSTIQLNGNKSSGFGQLLYKWEIEAKPNGSQTNIVDNDTVLAEFVADLPGEYIIRLLVKDTTGDSSIDRVVIKVGNTIKGDVNEDGKIDVIDALWIAQYTVGLRQLTPAQLTAADVNCDSKVDVTDALFISQYTVGLRQKPSC